MPLQQIAQQIITLADRRASTPVLVTPPYLSFRHQFYLELTQELSRHTERTVRIDWYRGLPGFRTLISDQLAAWHVKSINRVLRTQGDPGSANAPETPSTGERSHTSVELGQPDHDPFAALAQTGSPKAAVQITASIARPGGKTRDLVIGLADVRQQLPDWTTAIWLGTSQSEIDQWRAA